MQWLELTIKTASAGIDLVAERLTVLGHDSFIIDDQADFDDFLENNKQYWDYVDEDLEQKMQGLSQIRLYIEDGPTAMETVSELRTQMQLLRQQHPRQELGTLEIQLANLQNDVKTQLYYKIECKPAGGYISSVLKETDGQAKVLIGNAGYQFLECFDRGAIGAMPGASMFDLYLQIYHKYMAGDRAGAKKLHGEVLLPFLNHIRQNVEMIITYEKRIMHRRGVIATDYCRKPSFATDPVFDALFEEFLEDTKPYFSV